MHCVQSIQKSSEENSESELWNRRPTQMSPPQQTLQNSLDFKGKKMQKALQRLRRLRRVAFDLDLGARASLEATACCEVLAQERLAKASGRRVVLRSHLFRQ